MVEVTDISGRELTCDPITIEGVTVDVEAAIGGLVNGIPTFCGGSYPTITLISKACFQLQGNTFKPIQDLDNVLHRAASANAGGKFFVSGGFSSNLEGLTVQKQFFQLSHKGLITYEDMQMELAQHCMVAITDSKYKLLVIGGLGTSLHKQTWAYQNNHVSTLKKVYIKNYIHLFEICL
jgi:hypothetical protein